MNKKVHWGLAVALFVLSFWALRDTPPRPERVVPVDFEMLAYAQAERGQRANLKAYYMPDEWLVGWRSLPPRTKRLPFFIVGVLLAMCIMAYKQRRPRE